VASKPFAENRILAEVMKQLIEARTELDVRLEDGLGGTLLIFAALRQGDVDLYPEYTGTGWAVVLEQDEVAGDPLRTFSSVAAEYERRFDLRWLAPFGFSNSYALAVRGDVAERLDLHTVSDLVPHAPGLRGGVSHEFLERDDGWPGLEDTYGLRLAELRGMEHGLAFKALDAGEIDLIDAWTTDGKLLRYDVRVLEDDRGFWPPYHCAPLIRGDTLRAHPELQGILGELAWRLPERRMQALNAQVEIEGRSFRDVARQFLADEGLVAEGDLAEVGGAAPGERRGSLGEFVKARLGITLRLTGEHLMLTLGAVFAAMLISLPLGIALVRRPRTAQVVLAVAGVLQTIPGLALLAFMIPLLGLGLDAAYAALIVYAILPILRNTYTGLTGVDPELIEAATGMGLHPRQVLWRVELPLALRTIMAGIRTSTVITLGVATLAAFIGAGGLGEPIVTGLQLDDTRLVLAGAVPAALLAIVADVVLERVERRLTPGPRRG